MYKTIFVDDEYMILEGLKRIIPWEELGFTIVYTAKRAADILRYLQTHEADLLITDVTMPEMSGIELVQQLKKQNISIETLILSGYQEFEYVKQGMELGVKGYLLKPVDKKELVEKVNLIREALDQKEEKKETQALYQSSVVYRWLNDELNEAEYLNFMGEMNRSSEGPFSVLIIQHTITDEAFNTLLHDFKQTIFVQQQLPTYKESTIIFQGNYQRARAFTQKLNTAFGTKIVHLTLGEEVNEWENVYESYEKVRKLLAFEFFYADAQVGTEILSANKNDENQASLHFLSFNKALMIGDKQTIKEGLTDIFRQMSELKFTPENVRHVAFLLFTDIYRQYPTLEKEVYDETLAMIKNSARLVTIQAWLTQVLEMTYHSPKKKRRYSELVQQAVQQIEYNYQEELTLKTIAEELHVNPVYLGKLFKTETERSFAQYLNQIRIKKAQQLLIDTDDSIYVISEVVGYNALNYFSKMFRKLNGMTPKEFRERYTQNYQAAELDEP